MKRIKNAAGCAAIFIHENKRDIKAEKASGWISIAIQSGCAVSKSG
jgi:hypothetical protein